MKVKILVAGRYMGMDLKVVECVEGQELETRNEYAQSLLEDGYAGEAEAPKAEKPKGKRKPAAKKQADQPQPKGGTGNVFLE